MFLIVDNIDSFVWNLVRYLELTGVATCLCRNDELDLDAIEQVGYEGIVLSPGPGLPSAANGLLPLIRRMAGRVPMLGVCLGHQAIAQASGAEIVCGEQPMHGKLSAISHDGCGVFAGLPSPLTVTRYHSMVVSRATLPPTLTISSCCSDGTIMGLRSADGMLEGVQFHPEAELTEHGLVMIQNFVDYCRQRPNP